MSAPSRVRARIGIEALRRSWGGFFRELRRRQVSRVAVTYGAVGWIVVQASTALVPALGIPHWTLSLVTVLLLLGFPVALVLAWAVDLTPLPASAEGDGGPAVGWPGPDAPGPEGPKACDDQWCRTGWSIWPMCVKQHDLQVPLVPRRRVAVSKFDRWARRPSWSVTQMIVIITSKYARSNSSPSRARRRRSKWSETSDPYLRRPSPPLAREVGPPGFEPGTGRL